MQLYIVFPWSKYMNKNIKKFQKMIDKIMNIDINSEWEEDEESIENIN